MVYGVAPEACYHITNNTIAFDIYYMQLSDF